METGGNCLPADVPEPRAAIVIRTVESVLRDNNGLVREPVVVDIAAELVDGDIVYDNRVASPPVMPVVRFGGGQREPSDIRIRVEPADPARVPAVGYAHADYRRRPEPAVINPQPVPIMHRSIPERFFGNPCIITVIVAPPSHRVRRPVWVNPDRMPGIVVVALVAYSFPSAALIQVIGIVLQIRRQVSRRLTLDLGPFSPHAVTGRIPLRPGNGCLARSGCHLLPVGHDGRRTRGDLILRLVGVMDEIDRPLQGDYLRGLIAYVEVKTGLRRGDNIAERGCNLDHAVPAFVIETSRAGSDIRFHHPLLKGDKLYLRVAANSYPGTIRHVELGLYVVSGV